MAPTLGGRERSKNILLPRIAIHELAEYAAASRAGKRKRKRRGDRQRGREGETTAWKIYPTAWIPVVSLLLPRLFFLTSFLTLLIEQSRK